MTIKDIAKASGYSVSTVSRMLNNHPDVSDQTKGEIAAVVAAYQFVPNSNARRLKQQQSRSLMLLVKGSNNLLLASLLERLQTCIDRDGYQAVVHYLDEDGDELAMAQKLCRENKPMGLIFLGGDVEAFKQKFEGIPVSSVLATSLGSQLSFENLSTVGVDDEKSAFMAVEYLVQNGHTDIAMLGADPEESSISRNRHHGFCRCLTHYGLTAPPVFHCSGYSYQSGYEGMRELLEKHPSLSAVFATSDVVAIGAMRAIVDAGLSVPEDVSVIGFDGIELGRYYNPVLVSVRQPVKEIAETSVELLLRSIERGAVVRNVEMPSVLTEGGSVRRIIR